MNILEDKKGRRCYGHMAAFFSLPFRSSTVIQGCLQHQGQSSPVLLLDAGLGGNGMEDRSKEGDDETWGKHGKPHNENPLQYLEVLYVLHVVMHIIYT